MARKTIHVKKKPLISLCKKDCEEFTDKQAVYYNKRIRQFESGNYEGTRKVDLEAIRQKQS